MARRFSIRCPMVVVVDGEQHKATCVDVSSSGLGMRTKLTLPPGTNVKIELSLPDCDLIESRAEVVRTTQDDDRVVGLRFIKLSQRSLRTIHAFLNSRTKEG